MIGSLNGRFNREIYIIKDKLVEILIFNEIKPRQLENGCVYSASCFEVASVGFK